MDQLSKLGKGRHQSCHKFSCKKIFCHLSVGKAITNDHMQNIKSVEVGSKELNIVSKPTEKVRDLIYSRLKTTMENDTIMHQTIKEETIRKSRNQIEKNHKAKKQPTTKMRKFRKCYACWISLNEIVTLYDNSIRRYMNKFHPASCKLSNHDFDDVCPVVRIES